MKKFVSVFAALAVVTAMAVPAMAATSDEVITAIKNAGASADHVTAAQTYLNTVKLSSTTLDTVLANVNKGATAMKDGSAKGDNLDALAQETVNVVNADPAAKNHPLELRISTFGDVKSVAIVSNIATAGVDVNTATGKVGAINSMNGANGGSNATGGSTGGVIKATGAEVNMSTAVAAALAMAATLGTAVVYGVKKGLLAK